jgi:SAM-dependent methyltransferase
MGGRIDREREFHDRAFEDGRRAGVTEFYEVVRGSRRQYEEYLRSHAPGSRVLEYGCGPGSSAFSLAEHGAKVTGIDISPVAIKKAVDRARREGVRNAEFRVMDAENLEFEDGSFDLVCGTGILHHLDLKKAFAEISRVLRPGGSAVFIEPLGHNPLINRFRGSTPELRTEDEHPLLMEDIRLAERLFGRVDMQPYGFLTLAAIPLRRRPGFRPALAVLEKADRVLFAVLPFVRRYSWQAVLTLTDPKKGGG